MSALPGRDAPGAMARGGTCAAAGRSRDRQGGPRGAAGPAHVLVQLIDQHPANGMLWALEERSVLGLCRGRISVADRAALDRARR